MPELPVGTITLLFTDIEGSTRLLQQLGDCYPSVLAEHHRILRAAVGAHGGRVVDTQGDAFFVAFARAVDAVAAAVEAQRALASHPWPEGAEVRARMGLHTGEPRPMDSGYVGLDLHRAARICAAGHGGQVLLSEAARVLVQDALPEGTALQNLGEHRLKDLQQPERLAQLVIPGLPAGFPPLRSLDFRPHNLPVQATVLLGREREIGEVRALLRRDDIRLITLTGPGGTGKTRLSLHAAADVIDQFEHGVFLVPLAPLVDPALVPSVIAETLGLRDLSGRSATESLTAFLCDRRLLLVLDNFEQILPAATVVADLLGAAPGLRVLVTSREPLRLRSEREYPVPPLPLPDRGRPPLLPALSRYGAVALFVERAVGIKPDFTLTDDNASAVAEICARLDGLPLAIELAAARIRLLSPEAILKRLEQRLPLLTGGARDLPARLRTMRDAIAWSYDLLDPTEQRLFRRLGVFAGGWTLDSADAICDLGGDCGLNVLDGLESLVAKSLVVQRQTVDGEPRFGVLETIREFALEQLAASGEESELRRRHAIFFLGLAEEAAPKLLTGEQVAWLEQLDREHDNLRVVLAWSLESGADAPAGSDPTEVGLRLGAALGWFWFLRGYAGEGRRWLEAALARSEPDRPTPARARALHALRGMALQQGDYGAVQVNAEEGLRIARSVGDRHLIGLSLLHLGVATRHHRGDTETARTLLAESLAVLREVGDAWGAAFALRDLGVAAWLAGDLDGALAYFEESLALFRSTGERFGLSTTLGFLGTATLRAGDHHRAAALLRAALAASRELRDRWTCSAALIRLAHVAATIGDHRAAARLFGASEGLLDTIAARHTPIVHTVLEATCEAARPALGERVFDAEVAAGRAMTMEQAVGWALSNSP
jgi:predicted ATPase/class 3 adenylate cyclase